jgi:hypothetical protein
MTFPWLNLVVGIFCFYFAFERHRGFWSLFWLNLGLAAANFSYVVYWMFS